MATIWSMRSAWVVFGVAGLVAACGTDRGQALATEVAGGAAGETASTGGHDEATGGATGGERQTTGGTEASTGGTPTGGTETGGAPTCQPATLTACTCDDGSDGARVCRDDGSGWGDCGGCLGDYTGGTGGQATGGTGGTVDPSTCPGTPCTLDLPGHEMRCNEVEGEWRCQFDYSYEGWISRYCLSTDPDPPGMFCERDDSICPPELFELGGYRGLICSEIDPALFE